MISIIIIILISGIILYTFKSDYYKGLCASIFFLILMPANVTINLPGMLPALTIHRIIIFLWFFKWLKNRQLDKKIGNIPFAKLLIVIAFSYLISTLLSSWFSISLKRYLYFLIESVLFFILLQTSFTEKSIIQKTIITVSFSLAVVSVLAIIEKKTGFNITPMLGMRESDIDFHPGLANYQMVTATYGHRILLGLAMSINVIFNLIQIDKNNQKSTNRKYLIYLLLSIAALYYSASRGPWIAAIIAIVFALILNPKDLFKKIALLSILTLLILILLPGVWVSINELIESTFNPQSLRGSSFNWRSIVWNNALSELEERGILKLTFGSGGGSHIFLEFDQVVLSTGHMTQLLSWDLEYAIILFERGILGFILLITLYLTLLLKGIKHYFSQISRSKELLISLSSLAAFIFIKTNVSVFIVQCTYLEFISIAIISAMVSERFNSNANQLINKKTELQDNIYEKNVYI